MNDREKAFDQWWHLTSHLARPEARESLARQAYYAAWGGGGSIDRITAERDVLRTQNETLAEIAKARRDKCDALTAARDGLISENERLKAKLKELGHGER